MEELLVHALLLYEGLEAKEDYIKRLDEMFLHNPTDEVLLDLEYMTNDIKNSIVYIRTSFDYNNFDHNIFGRILMGKLKECYVSMELERLADRMYSLWNNLPRNIQDDEPFFMLSYADEPLSWGDVKQTRQIFEGMLNYYD